MNLHLNRIGKKFQRDWIFRDLTYSFQMGHAYAILGPNGSGKSTLMRIISGFLTPSEGNRKYENEGKEIEIEKAYHHMAYSGPYIDLIEEFTLEEQIAFHREFKPFVNNLDLTGIIDLLHFDTHRKKEVRNLSSGMKQRLKLVLTICSDVPMILLDEPATNLDGEGVSWYQQLIAEFGKERLVIVASNREDEYAFCGEQLEIGE